MRSQNSQDTEENQFPIKQYEGKRNLENCDQEARFNANRINTGSFDLLLTVLRRKYKTPSLLRGAV